VLQISPIAADTSSKSRRRRATGTCGAGAGVDRPTVCDRVADRDQTPDLKYATRQTEALPILARFRQWLEGNVIGLPAQAPLAKSFGYALRHWQALIRYTESGILLPDNNAIERQIRSIALGRANCTFRGLAAWRQGRRHDVLAARHGTAERLRALCMAQGHT
jgi:hypothetical protein